MLVALIMRDRWSVRAELFLRTQPAQAVVSDFATLEFASVVARSVRTQETTVATASTALARLDRWAVRNVESIAISPADLGLAATYIRRLDLTLRAPDAISIAMAMRAGAALATFDTRMEAAARTLVVPSPRPPRKQLDQIFQPATPKRCMITPPRLGTPPQRHITIS